MVAGTRRRGAACRPVSVQPDCPGQGEFGTLDLELADLGDEVADVEDDDDEEEDDDDVVDKDDEDDDDDVDGP